VSSSAISPCPKQDSFRLSSFFLQHWFVLGLCVAVALPFFLAYETISFFQASTSHTLLLAVFVIFFLQGLTLRLGEFAQVCTKPKAVLWVLVWNFCFTPLSAWVLSLVLAPWMSEERLMGFLFLSLLPTTVSSAIALVAMARGSVVTSIVSTAASNLLAVVTVPFWVWVFFGIGTSDVGFTFGDTFLRLLKMIFVPLFLGQTLRRLVPWLQKASLSWVNVICQILILWIIFLVFCGSVATGDWSEHSWMDLALAFLVTLLFFAWVSASLWHASSYSSLSREQKIAVFFCGSQKGMATGAPLCTALFLNSGTEAGFPPVGIILLPLLLYHPLQLFLGGWFATRLSLRAKP